MLQNVQRERERDLKASFGCARNFALHLENTNIRDIGWVAVDLFVYSSFFFCPLTHWSWQQYSWVTPVEWKNTAMIQTKAKRKCFKMTFPKRWLIFPFAVFHGQLAKKHQKCPARPTISGIFWSITLFIILSVSFAVLLSVFNACTVAVPSLRPGSVHCSALRCSASWLMVNFGLGAGRERGEEEEEEYEAAATAAAKKWWHFTAIIHPCFVPAAPAECLHWECRVRGGGMLRRRDEWCWVWMEGGEKRGRGRMGG